MIVRSAQPVDLDGLVRLAGLHTVGGSAADFLDRFTHDLESDDRCLLVAIEDQVVVGYGRVSWFEPDTNRADDTAPRGYYLLGLVVDPDHRRRGIAGMLTAERVAWVRGRGADEVWYFTHATNLASQHLHHRFGFDEVTRDFVFPGVSFDRGVGILSRAGLQCATRDSHCVTTLKTTADPEAGR